MSESRTSPRRVQAAINRVEMVKRRVEGQSLRAIADALDLSVSTVHEAIDNELKRLARETASETDTLRELELARLDGLLFTLWPKVSTGHVPSVNSALSVIEKRCRLLGLDAPQRHETKLTLESRSDIELIDEAKVLGIPIPPELLRRVESETPALTYHPNQAG